MLQLLLCFGLLYYFCCLHFGLMFVLLQYVRLYNWICTLDLSYNCCCPFDACYTCCCVFDSSNTNDVLWILCYNWIWTLDSCYSCCCALIRASTAAVLLIHLTNATELLIPVTIAGCFGSFLNWCCPLPLKLKSCGGCLVRHVLVLKISRTTFWMLGGWQVDNTMSRQWVGLDIDFV